MRSLSRQQGKKTGVFRSSVQVEVDGNVLGESEKKEVPQVAQRVDYDFTCGLLCRGDAEALSELLSKPLIRKPCPRTRPGKHLGSTLVKSL